jgi:hypothetical protein
MLNYKIYTIQGSTLYKTYRVTSEDEVWKLLSSAKKLPITELKKIFKIEKYANRTNDNN